MTTTRISCINRTRLKRGFFFLLVITVICLFYIGYNSRVDVTVFVTTVINTFQGLDVIPTVNSKWQKISIYDVFDKHKSRTNKSCVNVCDAKNDSGCAATRIEQWEHLIVSSNLKVIPLMSKSEYIYPFEVDYLSQPPLTDRKQLPNLTLSKVILYGAVKDQVSCAVGEVIKGRVDLVDGFGKQRIMGGDDVRVWIVSGENKAVGRVMDFKNGSYQISARCLWPGKTQLNVAVQYPREYVRVVVQQIQISAAWFYAIKFKKDNIEEVTLCFTAPNVPGRPCLCNLTDLNQHSKYCGRPLDSRLGCNDWVQINTLSFTPLRNVTPVESQLIREIPKPISKYLITHNYTLNVTSGGSLPAVKPCKETNLSMTWDLSNLPNGYWTAGENWDSMICSRPKLTSAWAASCLKNTKVWIFGDSNGVRLINSILNLVNTTVVQAGEWPKQYSKKNAENNILLTFTPIEYPVYLGGYWRDRVNYGGVAKQIDNFSSTEAHVIVVHYYLHIAPSHLSLLYPRLKAVRDAVERLLNRNPNVTVGIRGPHVSSYELSYNHASNGDNLGWFFLQMTLDVFADIKHRVVFLDGWEMTIANENPNYHPSNSVPFELMRTLLAFKCS